MGTKDLSFVQLNQLIGRKTGGISVYPLTSSVRGKEDPCCRIVVRGKAMGGRAEDLFNLVHLLQILLLIHHFSFWFSTILCRVYLMEFSATAFSLLILL